MRTYVLASLLLACNHGSSSAVDSGTSSDAPAIDTAGSNTPDSGVSNALPLGTVTAQATACSTQGGQPEPGATCESLVIDCGGLYTDTVEIAISTPATTPVGTMTLHDGGGGTTYWGTGPGNLVEGFLANNLRVVQLKWKADWQIHGVGALHSGCLPATAYKWIHDNVHTSGGFCGGGISGGGASLGYSLAAYGLGSIFDYTMIVSGPAVSKMDVGCDVPDYTGPAPAFCPEIPQPVDPLPAGAIDGIESTTTCSCTTPDCVLPADKTAWHADSIVTDGATYAYPKTAMSFWFCGNNNANGSSGGGAFYYDAVHAVAGNDVSIHCYAGDTSTCSGEQVFVDKGAQADAIAAVSAGCIDRHQ